MLHPFTFHLAFLVDSLGDTAKPTSVVVASLGIAPDLLLRGKFCLILVLDQVCSPYLLPIGFDVLILTYLCLNLV